MKKRVIIIAAIVLLLVYLGVSLGFMSERRDRLVCTGIVVTIPDSMEHRFLGRRDVMALIMSNGHKWIGEYLRDINTQSVESLIYRNPAVKEAKVFKTVGGTLKIEVTQRQPVLRIINRYGENFYIDDDGGMMPWSAKFTARVLVANWNIPDRFDSRKANSYSLLSDTTASNHTLKDLTRLALFIRDNDFWNAQIEQVFVEENGDFDLIPRVGGHLIILGKLDDMEDKFAKLKLMYEVGLPNEGWNKYSTINLKFRNQVVCTKK